MHFKTYRSLKQQCPLCRTDIINIIDYNNEQININKSIVGDKGKLLTENLEVTINFYNENKIALVDCNSFYVSCERLFNPSIIKKPVIVLSSNDGCIISR